MTKSILKRGFKTQAERLAKQYREELNIHACGALCAFKLSEHLGVPTYKATDFVNQPHEINSLSGVNSKYSEWSALTMITKLGNRIIIYNPFHTFARQQSDIMHEVSHIICKHERKEKALDFEIPFGLREFDKEQEEEANCLGSTLQLATPCLLWASKRSMSIDEIAAHFNASPEMVNYRMNIVGINRRHSY